MIKEERTKHETKHYTASGGGGGDGGSGDGFTVVLLFLSSRDNDNHNNTAAATAGWWSIVKKFQNNDVEVTENKLQSKETKEKGSTKGTYHTCIHSMNL